MQDEKEPKSVDSTNDEATSSETLSDLENNEDVSNKPGDNRDSDPISPDGITRSDDGERSSKDDAGPI